MTDTMIGKADKLTFDRLRQVLTFNPDTGIFIWQLARQRIRVGGVAGSLKKGTGYWQIWVDGKNYHAHRLAWLYVYGTWPKADIDHMNLVKTDNRIDNLRDATKSQNQGNRHVNINNTSGFKGVQWFKRGQKWRAEIMINGRNKHLGYFEYIEDAADAYKKAAHAHFCEFARVS